MKNIVHKLCEKIKSEWPAFKRLTCLSARLVMKKIDKDKVAAAKSELSTLFAQTKFILSLAVGLLVVLGIVMLRGCGDSTMPPTQVVQAFYEEVEKLPSKPSTAELQRIEDTYCNGKMFPTPDWIQTLGMTISRMKSDYNVKRSIRERYSQSGDTAKVLIDCSIRLYGKSVDWTVLIKLEKVNGKWLISNNPLMEEDEAAKNARKS